jgi:hypothetical protein
MLFEEDVPPSGTVETVLLGGLLTRLRGLLGRAGGFGLGFLLRHVTLGVGLVLLGDLLPASRHGR